MVKKKRKNCLKQERFFKQMYDILLVYIGIYNV